MTKRSKNLIVSLGMIGIIMVLACVAGVLLWPRTSEEVAKKDPNPEPSAKPTEVVIETPPEDIVITVSLAGDCTFGTDVNYAGGPSFVAKYNEKNDPSYFLAGVQSVFANDDLTIVNFEGTLTSGGVRQDKEFAFRGDPSYVKILTEGSVEAACVANNHSRDYGMESLYDTQRHLTEAGVTYFGYVDVAIVECKGIKIGLVGIYELPDGLGRMQQLKDNIAKAKAEGAVITIVNFHWGIEREYYPNDVQKQLAHAAIDNGADLVVGEHPHVIQGVETYKDKKIVYSMGNFCFGGNKNPSDKDSMIVQQTFTIRDGQILTYEDFEIIPCSLSSVSHVNDYQPTILKGAEAERVIKKLDDISEGLSQ